VDIVKLSEILTESTIESANPHVSKRLRVRLNANGVEKRPETNDLEGATKYYVRKAGQFIYGRQNLHKGAFGVVPKELDGFESSADIPAFDVAEKCFPEWVELFLKQDNFYLQLIKIATGVGSKRISPKRFLALEIPLPSVGEQGRILKRVHSYSILQGDIKSELTHQQSLLKKLRQQILQEAIEGKLTAVWRKENPDVEPASKLLKRIAAEKTRLIRDKKIKPQKPLPPINDEEKPFELPDGWVWCRLGSYVSFERGKFSIRPRNDPSCFGGQYPFIQIGSLDYSGSIVSTFTQTLNEKGLSASKMFKVGTIMVAIVGGTIGNLGVLGIDMCFPDSIIGIRPRALTNQEYILFLLRYFQPHIRKMSYQMAGQPNIKLPTLENLIFALPPFSEQKAIVAKVEKLLALCDKLEAQINQNQTHAQQLMQAVLKDAFQQSDSSNQLST
jgi:type I restriction enzyme S subunit